MEPETEFRPGRLLLAEPLACIGPLAWIMSLSVEALHFDVVIAESMTRLVKSTVKLTTRHSAGIRRLRGRTRRPACAPEWLHRCPFTGVRVRSA